MSYRVAYKKNMTDTTKRGWVRIKTKFKNAHDALWCIFAATDPDDHFVEFQKRLPISTDDESHWFSSDGKTKWKYFKNDD